MPRARWLRSSSMRGSGPLMLAAGTEVLKSSNTSLTYVKKLS
jgi:hypothetical protein